MAEQPARSNRWNDSKRIEGSFVVLAKSLEHLKEILSLRFEENRIHVVEDRLGTFIGVDLSDSAEGPVVLDDRHSGIHVRIEALLEAVHVVISSAAAGLTSSDAPLDALVLRALEEQNEQKIDFRRHLLLPALQVVFVTWKAVDEKFIVASFLKRIERLHNESIGRRDEGVIKLS